MELVPKLNLVLMWLVVTVPLQYMSLLSTFWQPIELEKTTTTHEANMDERVIERNESTIHHLPSVSTRNTENLHLSTYMVDNVPTDQARFLLDFIVAGFPMCGTTMLGAWLGNHPEVQLQRGEKSHHGFPVDKMVRSLFLNMKQQKKKDPFAIKKGFRSPHYIQSYSGNLFLQQYFQDTKIVVSVWHPVLWFESYYNAQLEQDKYNVIKNSPNDLIGEPDCDGCRKFDTLSTAKGRFHRYLARLHKTPLSDPEEMHLLGAPHQRERPPLQEMTKTNNTVFFLEMSQLEDDNFERSHQLRQDLQTFLGLKTDFSDEAILLQDRKGKMGNPTRGSKGIDICNVEYLPVRRDLMDISRNASLWFRNYFLKSDEVFVSSRDYLDHILEEWMVDPCQKRIVAVS